MTRTRKLLVGGAALAAASIAGVAVASGGDDSEPPITGADYDRASAAALEHTGGGTVTETEVGDEDSYYEVEVTMPDGTTIDVQLDEDFGVVGDEVDDAAEDDDGEDDD